ncbi:TetR family transcriptional regulator [Gandjariella thermophila]|uniref:TetR family transcriptional regulator n=1 Tax=Gandjariella thermophila TaxID=1931992 RepID=A0A4D4J6D5_9PSEU|nr:TetR family transcriptional regulator [Gandjariella thermophila]
MLLDAARACVLAVGFRRTTLTEVARRAGVSRMTVYRRFPDARSLVAALMTREFRGLLDQAAVEAERAAAGGVRQRLVAATVACVHRLVENPLLRTVLELDPELLLPYLVERIGSTQRLAEQFLRERVVAGHRDGSVRRGDADAQARMLFLTAQAVVLAPRPAISGVAMSTLLDELAHHLDAALRPPADALPPAEAADNPADALPPAEAADNPADALRSPEAADNTADAGGAR